MATFEAQVEGLTGLAIESANSNPTQDELSQFLKDGVADVVERWTVLRPQDAGLFARTSSTSDSQAGLSSNSGKIISVVREANTADDWRKCTKIPLDFQGRVVDTNSLHFASIYNPVYTVSEDGAVLVFPVPSSDNGYKLYYINAEAKDAAGNNALVYSHSDIKFFPEEKVRLVVLYSGMKALQAAMGGMHEDAGINAAFTNFKTNVLSGINQFDDAIKAAERVDSNLYNAFNFDQTKGKFKDVTNSLKKAQALIDGAAPATGYNAISYHLREDPELVGSALQLSTSELQQATAHMNELASILDLSSKEVNSFLTIAGGYVQSASTYLTEVQALSGESVKKYGWYNTRYRELKAEYDAAFGIAAPQRERAQ